ncbi:hypothetical protein SH661x_001793 [Planctomicrobium sp. SH661]|uniref:hypothetical protein n=1 Tax=Planctomicrobium sp. SH661 TaxID=3448124 RepID=UPI003F5AE698
MQMTREGNIAYTTPLYLGRSVDEVDPMLNCDHEFKDTYEQPSPHPGVKMYLQTCQCRATRVKLVGDTEGNLLRALQ